MPALYAMRAAKPITLLSVTMAGTRLGRIVLTQLLINCRISFLMPLMVLVCSLRRRIHHVPAQRKVIDYNNFASLIIVDMYSIMLIRLQELRKSCRVPVILFYFIANGRTVLQKRWFTMVGNMVNHGFQP